MEQCVLMKRTSTNVAVQQDTQDESVSKVCNGAVCINGENIYYCSCTAGYTGPICKQGMIGAVCINGENI